MISVGRILYKTVYTENIVEFIKKSSGCVVELNLKMNKVYSKLKEIISQEKPKR